MRKAMFGETVNSSIRTLTHLWTEVVLVSRCGLFSCIWATPACHHWWKNEYWIIPAGPKGKSQDICAWTESREKVGKQQDNDPKHTSLSSKEWWKKKFWNVLESQSPDLCGRNWSEQFIWGNPPTSQSWRFSVRRNGLKLLQTDVQDWSTVTRNNFFALIAAGGHTRYLNQKFTYFCHSQMCNIGSFSSVNKWPSEIFVSFI